MDSKYKKSKHIIRILDYMWRDERRNFEEETVKPKHHIFKDMMRVRDDLGLSKEDFPDPEVEW